MNLLTSKVCSKWTVVPMGCIGAYYSFLAYRVAMAQRLESQALLSVSVSKLNRSNGRHSKKSLRSVPFIGTDLWNSLAKAPVAIPKGFCVDKGMYSPMLAWQQRKMTCGCSQLPWFLPTRQQGIVPRGIQTKKPLRPNQIINPTSHPALVSQSALFC